MIIEISLLHKENKVHGRVKSLQKKKVCKVLGYSNNLMEKGDDGLLDYFNNPRASNSCISKEEVASFRFGINTLNLVIN